jgi:hypothetical protein
MTMIMVTGQRAVLCKMHIAWGCRKTVPVADSSAAELLPLDLIGRRSRSEHKAIWKIRAFETKLLDHAFTDNLVNHNGYDIIT